MNNENLKWFAFDTFNQVEIKKLQGGHLVASAVSTDIVWIESLVQRIKCFPTEGALMVSRSAAVEVIQLVFQSNRGNDLIEIFGNSFRTPATGYSPDEAQAALVQEIKLCLEAKV